MSSDWIKMRVGLKDHPKVVRMASALRADRLRIVGGLHAVWSLLDAHTVDGILEGYTPEAMDESIGWPGFTDAMARVGWMTADANEDSQALVMPRFAEHNGKSAKRRATDAKRKSATREADKGPKGVGNLSASDADNTVTRERERERERVERKDPPLPHAGANDSPAGPTPRVGIQAAPAALMSIALKRHGFLDVHSIHPDVIAACAEGVEPQDVIDIALAKPGKTSGLYYIAAARALRTQAPSAINGGTNAPAGSGRVVESAAERSARKCREQDEREGAGGPG